MAVDEVEQRYLGEEYFLENPSWDMEDSEWKARHVARILADNSVSPLRVCEIGCGAGRILSHLSSGHFPKASFVGYDIAPRASNFWSDVSNEKVRFYAGDFFSADNERYDIILVLDVLEHVSNPHAFLAGLRGRAEYVVIHFPLDLSALSVLREKPLISSRRKVGHIHYFTRGLALELMHECGFEVIDARYTGAAIERRRSCWKTMLASIPRRLVRAFNRDAAARLLGGETLMVLARSRS